MICKGVVIFKGIEKREGGTFKGQNGQEIKYDAQNVVKFDENTNGKYDERKLKFPTSNTYLANKFAGIKPYTEVFMECDVLLSNNSCKLVPINVETDIPEEYQEK